MAKTKRKGSNSGPPQLRAPKRRRTKRGPKMEERLRKGVDLDKATSAEFKAEMQRLKELRKAEKDDAKRQAMARRHAQIKAEYLKWQDDLCWLIRNQSRVEVRSDGTARYILPKELVRLVWSTTISQRVATEKAKGLSSPQAMAKAMESLSNEVAALAAKVREAEDESKRERPAQTDGGSAAEPGEMREDQPAG